MTRQIFRLLVIAFFITAIVLPSTSSSDSTGYKYACFYISSDPVGARVYGQDGLDWGITTEKGWITRIFREPNSSGVQAFSYTITLKKSGYHTTYHTFKVRFKNYSSQEDAYAKGNRHEITVVLDQCSP